MSGMHQPIDKEMLSFDPANEPILHLIDFEDVALTPVGLQMLHYGAQAALRHHLPTMTSDHLKPDEIVRMFIDQVYWEEKTGGLIMCSDAATPSLCLPIPRDQWAVRAQGEQYH